MTDVQPKAAPGTLWKPEKREKAPRRPMRQLGKVGKQRAADRRAKLRAEPAGHDGRRQCYIGLEWTEHVDLEHVIDSSHRPDLARDPRNHRWACNAHNTGKKNGTLTPAEEVLVQNAIEQVLFETEENHGDVN